jgi:stress-induced morphogen
VVKNCLNDSKPLKKKKKKKGVLNHTDLTLSSGFLKNCERVNHHEAVMHVLHMMMPHVMTPRSRFPLVLSAFVKET